MNSGLRLELHNALVPRAVHGDGVWLSAIGRLHAVCNIA